MQWNKIIAKYSRKQNWYALHQENFTWAATIPSLSRLKSVCDQALCDHGATCRRSSLNSKLFIWFFKNFLIFQGKSLCLKKYNYFILYWEQEQKKNLIIMSRVQGIQFLKCANILRFKLKAQTHVVALETPYIIDY